MFTGIIETLGMITKIEKKGTNVSFWVQSSISPFLQPDQSVSHNGVCLTVEEIEGEEHRVTAIDETLKVSTLRNWDKSKIINLERCLEMNGRVDGHIVQGHVDCVAYCSNIENKDGSWEYTFEIDPKNAGLIIEKGSVSLNGISLTIFNVGISNFKVAIIPYTYEHTNMQYLEKDEKVNIEFDMMGKYAQRFFSLQNKMH